ncbi:MAG: hypothetical protein H0X51_07175 [Parachlamydiaceae bacterium]|nr:hypothetical protein [Parachlamydiaceae bacterium]
MTSVGTTRITDQQITLLSREQTSQLLSDIEKRVSDTDATAKENFDSLKHDDKEGIKKSIQTAYVSLIALKSSSSDGTHELAARIFYLYARCVYGSKFERTRSLCELSLGCQLVALKAIKATDLPDFTQCAKLEDLPEWVAKQKESAADNFLMNNTEELTKLAVFQKPEQAFLTAMTLRWLGAAYHNISTYKKAEYSKRFENIYGTAEKIFHAIYTDKSLAGSKIADAALWNGIIELVYNTNRFRYYLANDALSKPSKEHIQGALKTLEPLQTYLTEDSERAVQKRAQIQNITRIEWSQLYPSDLAAREKFLQENPQIPQEQYKAMCEACALMDSLSGRIFLKTMFKNNKAAVAMSCLQAGTQVMKLEDLKKLMASVLEDITKEKFDHDYHVIFLRNAARLEFLCGNPKGTFTHLQKAKEIATDDEDIAAVNTDRRYYKAKLQRKYVRPVITLAGLAGLVGLLFHAKKT